MTGAPAPQHSCQPTSAGADRPSSTPRLRLHRCRQNIGRATNALFHSTGNQRLAIVSTEQAVLAALDLRTGEVAWRQVLPAGENVTAIQNNGRALLSLSTTAAGAYVRLWSLQGALLWDALIPAKEGKVSVAPEAAFVAGSVVVAWGDSVTAFEYGGGDVTWRWHATSGDEDVQLSRLLLLPAAEGAEPKLQALGLTSSAQMLVATLNPKDGTALATKSVSAPRGTTGLGPTTAIVATSDAASAALVDGVTLLLQHGLGGSSSLAPTPLQGLLPAMPGIEAAELLPLALPGVVAVRVTAKGGAVGTALIKLGGGGGGGAPTLLELLQGEHTLTHASSKEGKVLLAVVSPAEKPAEGAELTVRVLQLDAAAAAAAAADGAAVAWSDPESLPYAAAEHGALDAAWLNAYSRKDGSLGHRLLLSSADHSVQLVQATPGGGKGVSAWLREEALASVRGGLLLPFPTLSHESPADGSAPTFAFALPGLLEGLQRRLEGMQAIAAAGGKPDAAAEPAPRHADAYGTRQLLVLRSAQKVFGLHSSTGEVIWSVYVKSSSGADVEVKGVFVSRGSEAEGDAGTGKLWALVQDGGSWRVLTLSPTDGAVLSDVAEVGSAVHAAKLGLPDGGSALLVLVEGRLPGDALGAFVHPDTPATRRAVRAQMGAQFFYLLRAGSASGGDAAAAPTLQGYGLGLSAGAAQDDAVFEKALPPFVVPPRWSLALPADQVVTSAAFPPDAAAGSPVRVLGDRSVLHKYINRNLLAVGLATPPEADEPSVQVMLVDTVSGAVLHTARHAGCGAPLTMAMGEHWLVYHYWCEATLQYQATATELYTNTTLTDDPLGLLLSGPVDYTDTANMFDSFAASSARPHVLSQSYGFATGLAAMGVTLTAAGLTPKSVLAATAAGQLVTLEKRLLDPRRPAIHPSKMTQQQKEEGLVPYTPTLGGINPLSVTTHRHTIARPRAVLTAPTTLESTSLAVLVGLDLFLTRVAPAREFDRLNEDFNFLALIGATVFLVVATLGSGWYSKRRDLLAAWK